MNNEEILSLTKKLWSNAKTRPVQRNAKLAIGDALNEAQSPDEIIEEVKDILECGDHIREYQESAKWTEKLGVRPYLSDRITITYITLLNKAVDKIGWLAKIKKEKLYISDLREADLTKPTEYTDSDFFPDMENDHPTDDKDTPTKEIPVESEDLLTETLVETLTELKGLSKAVSELPNQIKQVVAESAIPESDVDPSERKIVLPTEKVKLLKKYFNLKEKKNQTKNEMAEVKEEITDGLQCKKAVSDIGDVIFQKGSTVITYPKDRIEETLSDRPELLKSLQKETPRDPCWQIRSRTKSQERPPDELRLLQSS